MLSDKFKNLGFFDVDTGEVVEGSIAVYVGGKVKWRENWFMGIQEAFIALAKDTDIVGRPTRILHYLFGKLGFENYICITQKEIGEELKIKPSNVSSGIKLLIAKGIIIKGPKLGRAMAYRLNSEFGWKGKIRNLSLERQKDTKAKMSELRLKLITTQLETQKTKKKSLKGSTKS